MGLVCREWRKRALKRQNLRFYTSLNYKLSERYSFLKILGNHWYGVYPLYFKPLDKLFEGAQRTECRKQHIFRTIDVNSQFGHACLTLPLYVQ
jgi:hypothetical protein